MPSQVLQIYIVKHIEIFGIQRKVKSHNFSILLSNPSINYCMLMAISKIKIIPSLRLAYIWYRYGDGLTLIQCRHLPANSNLPISRKDIFRSHTMRA